VFLLCLLVCYLLFTGRLSALKSEGSCPSSMTFSKRPSWMVCELGQIMIWRKAFFFVLSCSYMFIAKNKILEEIEISFHDIDIPILYQMCTVKLPYSTFHIVTLYVNTLYSHSFHQSLSHSSFGLGAKQPNTNKL
jgi:hypothetical protein